MKLEKFSIILSKMANDNLLADSDMKQLVKFCIRTVSETNPYHYSAHYRTIEIRERTSEIRNKTEYQKFCSKNFCHEHIVPCQALYEIILSLESPTNMEIEKILSKYSLRATITKEDDRKLNTLGFKSKMPSEFYKCIKGKENLYKNPFARYVVAGIDIKLEDNAISF